MAATQEGMVNVTADFPGTERRPSVRSVTPRPAAPDRTPSTEIVLRADHLTIRYGSFAAVRDVSLDIRAHEVTAIIGPSGCGKSTLLRAMNRMNDFVPSCAAEGRLWYRERNVYDPSCDPVELRRQIGMVFQKPNPFPKSIYRNVAWGASINGYQGRLDDLVESALKQAALWEEVKDKLHQNAYALSGGQQQLLCIARAIALQPDVLLMDEPCSALDPIATARVEDLIDQLKTRYTVVLVTHNMQQAARVSDTTAFMYIGELVEVSDTNVMFTNPHNRRTHDYITGRFG